MRILPEPETAQRCPDCGQAMDFRRVLWQGIHTCSVDHCRACDVEFASDFPVGQAAFTPYQVNLKTGELHGPANARDWFGQPLADALLKPDTKSICLHHDHNTERKQHAQILNCIDYIYGHALLKCFNIITELANKPANTNLIVIVQKALRWLVPDNVDKVITVELPFGKAAQGYYPALDKALNETCSDFTQVHICHAWSHPQHVGIKTLTGVSPHDFAHEDYRISYVWRGSRGWTDYGAPRWAGKKLGMHLLASKTERNRVVSLFETLRQQFPKVRFTMVGVGKDIDFPSWIDDQRMAEPTTEWEKISCQIYAESRLVIGPHGSNMLLPTAHAGMAITLMPEERWPNLAQDTAMWGQDLADPRLAIWRYRYVPTRVSAETLAAMASSMLRHYPVASLQFQAEAFAQNGLPTTTEALTSKTLHQDLLPKL